MQLKKLAARSVLSGLGRRRPVLFRQKRKPGVRHGRLDLDCLPRYVYVCLLWLWLWLYRV